METKTINNILQISLIYIVLSMQIFSGCIIYSNWMFDGHKDFIELLGSETNETDKEETEKEKEKNDETRHYHRISTNQEETRILVLIHHEELLFHTELQEQQTPPPRLLS